MVASDTLFENSTTIRVVVRDVSTPHLISSRMRQTCQTARNDYVTLTHPYKTHETGQ